MVDNCESDSDDDYDLNFISDAASRLQGILRKASRSPSLRVSTVKTPKRHLNRDSSDRHTPKRRRGEESFVRSPPLAIETSPQVKKRNTKATRAIVTLAAAQTRPETTIVDLDDSLEILEKSYEIPENFKVKIRWKHQVKRIETNPTERLGLMMIKFSDEVGVDVSMLRIFLDGNALDLTKSLEYYSINVVSILDAHKVVEEYKQTIKIKFQMEDRKNSRVLAVGITEKLEKFVGIFSAELHVPPNKISIVCDGETVSSNKTPLDLDLEDGDCLDLHFAP